MFNSPTLTLTVEGRNHDDTTWTTMGTFSSITTGGIKALDQSGLLEVLRFKYEVAGATATAGLLIEMLGPQWRAFQ